MSRRILASLLACAGLYASSVGAAPYVPASGDEVLERLPSRSNPAQKELRRLRAALTADPQDLRTAVELSRRYIDTWREGGDPRYLGYAQAALGPWWNLPEPPVAAQVMRATLLQSTHQFTAALADLDAVVKKDPDDAQAWLTRATILQVLGDYPQARRSCEQLASRAPALVVATCLSSVDSLSGQAEKGYRQLNAALKSQADVEPGIRLWILTLLAEMALRRGDSAAASGHFNEALSLGEPDNYLLAAYADFLIDRQEFSRVVELLKSKTQIDALLLRYAIALKHLKSPQAATYVDALRQRFDAARMRGDTIHQREQARFELDLMNNPRDALTIALQNWRVQKEPADTLLTLRAAVAANDRRAVRPVIEWLKTTGLEDHAMAPLIVALERER